MYCPCYSSCDPGQVDAFRKHCLLNGLDDIGLTLQKHALLSQYEAQRGQVSAVRV